MTLRMEILKLKKALFMKAQLDRTADQESKSIGLSEGYKYGSFLSSNYQEPPSDYNMRPEELETPLTRVVVDDICEEAASSHSHEEVSAKEPTQ